MAATRAESNHEFLAFLQVSGLIGDDAVPVMEPLTGGVSSDIWRVDLPNGPICIKRALSRLKVADKWLAPVERNVYEVRWMTEAKRIIAGVTPDVVADDPARGMFAMRYLDPAVYRSWKAELHAGHTDPAFAAAVGNALANIHAATFGRQDIARNFDSDKIFFAIRLEPYLDATARNRPEVAPQLIELSRLTAATKIALVHGDVSPKNILIGPDGPVFLDAECAWYGDPAFDLAFCLNHLLLKCLWTPTAKHGFLTDFEALAEAYLGALPDGLDGGLEKRVARLLPGLLLGRIDGKSPVEYVTEEPDKDLVRGVATELLQSPLAWLSEIRQAWATALTGRPHS
jgi:aminoglycoside phosphotransferase (APT) family kinase protein